MRDESLGKQEQEIDDQWHFDQYSCLGMMVLEETTAFEKTLEYLTHRI